MSFWRLINEKLLEEAIERGELNVPEAKGKPLDLTENPYIPEGQRLAFKLLKDNDLIPAWIADNKEIRESLEAARAKLRRDYNFFREAQRKHEGRVDIDSIYARNAAYQGWDDACEKFRKSIAKINKLTQTYNLRVPIPDLQRLYFDPEREIERVQSS
jgi:hypothetical protein